MCDVCEGNVVKTRIINYFYKCKVLNYIVREKGFAKTYIYIYISLVIGILVAYLAISGILSVLGKKTLIFLQCI